MSVTRLADTDTPRKPGMADFKPTIGGNDAGRGKRFRLSRSVAVIVVVGAHIVAGALFAIPVIQRVIGDAAPEELPGEPVTMVDMVIATQRDEAEKMTTGVATRPPVLKTDGADGPIEYAKRAGFVPAKSARALLLVRVDESGKPGDVAVADSSGGARVDRAAVEYARGLEWIPAMVAGRETTMSVRLLVDFDPSS